MTKEKVNEGCKVIKDKYNRRNGNVRYKSQARRDSWGNQGAA